MDQHIPIVCDVLPGEYPSGYVARSQTDSFQSAFIGRVFDSVGPRVLLALGTILMVFGLMMISLCQEYYQFFLAQGLVLGAGSALVYGCVDSQSALVNISG